MSVAGVVGGSGHECTAPRQVGADVAACNSIAVCSVGTGGGGALGRGSLRNHGCGGGGGSSRRRRRQRRRRARRQRRHWRQRHHISFAGYGERKVVNSSALAAHGGFGTARSRVRAELRPAVTNLEAYYP